MIYTNVNAQKHSINLSSDRSVDYFNDWHWMQLGYAYDLNPNWSLNAGLGYATSILYTSKDWVFNEIPRSTNEFENVRIQTGVSKVSFFNKEHVKMYWFTKFGFSKTSLCRSGFESGQQGLIREYSSSSLLFSNFTGINLKVKLTEKWFFSTSVGLMYFYHESYFRGPNLFRLGNEISIGSTF